MATLTPHFKEFLPDWISRQSWYPGTGAPDLQAVGFYRLEDPDGEVGMEAHVVSDGESVLHLPMTYRGAPLDGGALIATAEHSELGTRWIYDATTDPVWRTELLRVVRGNGSVDPSVRAAAGPAVVNGLRLRDFADDQVRIDLHRVLTPGPAPADPDVVGTLTGNWPQGELSCFAVVRAVS